MTGSSDAPPDAAAPYADAHATDPVRMAWMQGSPPPPALRIRFADGDHLGFPKSRWSFSHMRELVPTECVARGTGAPLPLPARPRALAGLVFHTMRGERMTWQESLQANYVDGIIVLHEGAVAFEEYFGAGAPGREHLVFSVTKSLFGLVAATLVAQGALDETRAAAHFIPELEGSAFADATVRELMDMLVGVEHSEDYADPGAGVWAFYRAGGIAPRPAGYSGPDCFAAFLARVCKRGQHGKAFDYKTVDTQVLGWILERSSGVRMAELLSRHLWRRIGAERDASITLDPAGMAYCGGGLCLTLRDLARLGEMLRLGGRCQGQQVVAQTVVDDIRAGGDREKFRRAESFRATLPDWSYRSCWWISHDAHGAFMARGIHGQSLYVDPAARMVIARFASHPVASNVANDAVTLPAFRAAARFLLDGGPAGA